MRVLGNADLVFLFCSFFLGVSFRKRALFGKQKKLKSEVDLAAVAHSVS